MSIIKNNKNYGTKVKLEDVPPVLTTLNATANGTYTPTSPVQGYSSVTVNVQEPVEPFYIKDISGVDNTVLIYKQDADAPTVEVFCSTDKTNWSSMGSTSTTPITATVPANSKLYLKAITNGWANTHYKQNTINVNRSHYIGGCIMSLLVGDNYENAVLTNSFEFFQLFYNNTTLINASALILPNNTTERCYQDMFGNCTALTVAPALPATSMSYGCYVGMFTNCTSLMQAPILPATTLDGQSYLAMFTDCSKLNLVICYAQQINYGTEHWLRNVAPTGDFYNLGGAQFPAGKDGIPTGWTEHNSL